MDCGRTMRRMRYEHTSEHWLSGYRFAEGRADESHPPPD